jgi:hypothetical protein
MPLREPPSGAGSLSDLPAVPLVGVTLYRVWRHRSPDGTTRDHPWWFASAPTDVADGGRFDLPEPMGTCYLATDPVAAILEALRAHLTALPTAELAVRRIATIHPPGRAPDAADVTDPAVTGVGFTAALWAGLDRPLTRRWAAAIRRDGWWALRAGIQHDPTGRLRAITLFDGSGGHPPTVDGEWTWTDASLDGDTDARAGLAACGVTIRGPANLPVATLDDDQPG